MYYPDASVYLRIGIVYSKEKGPTC
jgi:hypothetical protein